ncbi:Nuclear transport factor 2 [Linum grandiflorum]
MATEDSVPNAQLVGNAFVEQYYNMLSRAPENVHKFYQDSSVMSRPSSDGSMSSVSTMSGINDLIVALEYKNCEVQILTADAQKSIGEGVIVLVTGFLTGKDEIRRKFTELFFLAPQEGNGFFVLNDVLRYIDEDELADVEVSDAADVAEAPMAPITPEPEPTPVSNNSVEEAPATLVAEDTIQPNNEASVQLENGDIAIAEKEFVVPNNVTETPQSDAAPAAAAVATQEEEQQQVSEPAAPVSQEDAPKKSYASIANALNFKAQPFQQRVSPAKPVVRAPAPAPVAPTAEAAPAPRPARNSSVERNNNIVKGQHAIFVANLPMDATAEQLIETFGKFGSIKPTGVQVRSYKQERNCFGFVEFETAEAVENALQVATIMIGNREAHIEKKKAGGEGGKFPPRRGGFRNEGFRGGRGGGSYGGRGGGAYVKNDFEGNYAGQARGGGRGGEKVYQNGGGRGGGPSRQSRPPPASNAAPTEAGNN